MTFDPKCYWQQAGGHPRAHHITKRKVRCKDCGAKGHARGDWECYWQHHSDCDEMSSVEFSSESDWSSLEDFTPDDRKKQAEAMDSAGSSGLGYSGPYSGPSSPKTSRRLVGNLNQLD